MMQGKEDLESTSLCKCWDVMATRLTIYFRAVGVGVAGPTLCSGTVWQQG